MIQPVFTLCSDNRPVPSDKTESERQTWLGCYFRRYAWPSEHRSCICEADRVTFDGEPRMRKYCKTWKTFKDTTTQPRTMCGTQMKLVLFHLFAVLFLQCFSTGPQFCVNRMTLPYDVRNIGPAGVVWTSDATCTACTRRKSPFSA